MRPKPATSRRVRITLFVRILVMHAMRGDPENRSALECERAAGRQEILNPFRRLVAAVREQSMIAHTDAETSRKPPQYERYQERGCDPIHGPRKCFIDLQGICHCRVLSGDSDLTTACTSNVA